MNSKVFQILDVNFNRATEGLRVVEELCRFVLEDKDLSLRAKKLRGRLSEIVEKLSFQKFLKEREAARDVGRELYTKGEGRRKNMESIFRANMKRAQEAVRCLEEFSKLLRPELGITFKKVRFELYELEKQIALHLTKKKKLGFYLYVITDPNFGHFSMVRRAIASGIKFIQLRDKTVGKRVYFKIAKNLAKLTKKAGVTFILNDYWDLVKKVDADGVHLGQEDLIKVSLQKVRHFIGEDKIIGISTHSYRQAVRAQKMGADYISVGPMFITPSKPKTKPIGINLLRKVLTKVKIPVVAIGGINHTNVSRVIKTGCQRVAVIRAASTNQLLKRLFLEMKAQIPELLQQYPR